MVGIFGDSFRPCFKGPKTWILAYPYGITSFCGQEGHPKWQYMGSRGDVL